MKRRGIKTLQMIAVVIQLLVVAAVIGITMTQSGIKQMYHAYGDVAEYQSIPIDALLQTIPMLIIYIIGFLVMSRTNTYATKTKVVVLVSIACIFKVMSQYTNFLTIFIARQGEIAVASYGILSSAIAQIITPLVWSAFALFCVACGGYYELGNTEVE